MRSLATEHATILVLEDEAVVALELETRLRRLGYRVLGPAISEAEALVLCDEIVPDLLLADVRIAGAVDGIEVARALRSARGVPCVFLTAHSDTNTLRRIVEASPFGYLTKPFREAELHGTIQTALHRARLERELEERERRLREAYSLGNLGHWEWDPSTRRFLCSAELSAMLGHAESAAAGLDLRSVFRRVVRTDHATVRGVVDAALAGESEGLTASFRIDHPTRGRRHLRHVGEIRRGVTGRPTRVVGIVQDVTEVERAAALAREREERTRIAFEVSGDGEWDHSPESGRTFFSPRWKSMLGCEEHEIEDSIHGWSERIHPEDASRVAATLAKHLAGHTPVYVCEHRLRAKDGRYVNVLSRGKVVERDPSGLPLRVIGTHTDVSDLRRAEKAARDAEHRYRRLFEQAAIGVAEVDGRSRRVLRANARFATVLGYRPEELVGADLTELTHPDCVGRELEAIAHLSSGQSLEESFEKRVYDLRGHTLWLEQTLSRIDPADSADVRLVSVVQDVTARRNAEEQRRHALASLERTTHELEAMLAAFPDALVRVDREGFVLDVRAAGGAAAAALGQSSVGRALDAILPSAHRTAIRLAMRESLASGRMTRFEFDVVQGAQNHVYEGRFVASNHEEALLILREVTEQREAERALRAREEQLRQAQRLESVGRLAGGLAHDFNNLLSIVMCTAALLDETLPPEGDERRLVQDILDASKRASSITHQLLAFSRKQVTTPKEFDLNQRIVSFSRLIERTLGASIALELRLTPRSTLIRMDPSQFEQMLLNLVVNARDAMPEGGRVTLETHLRVGDPTSERAVGSHERAVELVVRDEGTGIDPAVLPNIFEPFFTTKDVGRGTGLGLSSVHGIVHQAEGRIRVESSVGHGTTFVVSLPTVSPSRTHAAPSASRPTRHGRRILLVDDERGVRRMTASMLAGAGFEVVEADDGIAAAALLRAGSMAFDALVTDLSMPRLDGTALAREARGIAGSELPVLFLTGLGEFPGDAARHGSILAKPFTPDSLIRSVRALLGVEG